MRVHVAYVINGELIPGVFRDRGSGMSTNWSKYCKAAEDARQKASKPADNGVVASSVKSVRAISTLQVEHTPKPEDRSHADVIGKKDTEVRMKLLRAFQWAIRVQQSRVGG